MDTVVASAGAPFADLATRSHAERESLSREMHVRGVPRLAAPARALQFVLLSDEADVARSIAALTELSDGRHGAPAGSDRFFIGSLGDLSFLWERHTEFITYTFIAMGADGALFDLAPFLAVPDFIARMPGVIIRSSQISLVTASPDDATIAQNFAVQDLIISDVANGRARVWSDFRLHADGFGRLLIQDVGLDGAEAAQLVQRLQELGNYRKVALLGLPKAREATPIISALEQELTAITGQLAQRNSDDDAILDKISELSAALAQIAAQTDYRMSATKAYAQLCLDRIRLLSVSPVRGYRSLDDFTERRLLPAMRTCEAFSSRVEDLAQRTAWTTALLRTRIDTAIARRNRDVLASMDRRTALQLRLQHAVEGLSVVAISYYAVGLWQHLHDAIAAQGVKLPGWIDVASIPAAILIAWLTIGRLKNVHRSQPEFDETA